MKKHKQKNFKKLIIEHVKNNTRDYLILLILFIIGIIVGIFFINHSTESQKSEIISYMNDFISSFKVHKEINYIELIKYSLFKNLFFAVILWLLGITLTLVPIIYGIITFRGFCLGYTIASAIAVLGNSKGFIFSITLLLLQNILIIPSIFGIAFSGIRLHNRIMPNKNNIEKSRLKHSNLKIEIIKHSLFSLLMTVVLIISSFIEIYASFNIFTLVADYF